MYNHALLLKHNAAKNTIPYMLGECIYLSRNYEQDAYINGMYADVKEKSTSFHDIRQLSENTHAYYAMVIFEECLYCIKEYIEASERIWKLHFGKYGQSFNSFLKEMNKALKRFKTKFGKAVIKIQKDLFDGKNYSPLPPKIEYTKEDIDKLKMQEIDTSLF
jgi:hypothetical protein